MLQKYYNNISSGDDMVNIKYNSNLNEGSFSEIISSSISKDRFVQYTTKGIHKDDVLELSPSQKKMFHKEKVSDIYPEIYLIKVDKYDDKTRDALDEWIYFFKNSEIKKEFSAKGLMEAREKLRVMNMEEDERMDYEKYLDNLRFEASMAKTYEFELKMGIEEDRERSIENFILKTDLTDEQIACGFDNLSIEEIKSIRKRLTDQA